MLLEMLDRERLDEMEAVNHFIKLQMAKKALE